MSKEQQSKNKPPGPTKQPAARQTPDLEAPVQFETELSGIFQPGIQAMRLSDERFDRPQRQRLAAQIGRQQGNHHLSQTISQLQRQPAQPPTIKLTPRLPGAGIMIQRDHHHGRAARRAAAPAFQPTFTSDAVGELRDRGYLVNPDNPTVAIAPTQWADRPRTRRLRAAAPAQAQDLTRQLDGLTELQTTEQAELEGHETRLAGMDRRERNQARAPTGQGSLTDYVSRLRRRIRQRTFQINALRAELSDAEALQQDVPPASLGNPNAVEVDLNRSGVQVRQKTGRQQATSEWRLDPMFALAMVNFLEAILSMGVTTLYNQGFLRDPISPQDTHPQGMACDISGFLYHGARLELSFNDDESAWFNTTSRVVVTGETYRDAIVRIARIMPSHFGQIIGPGHNAQHMNHFHVQTRGTRRVHGLNAPATPGSRQERHPYLSRGR